MPGSSTSAIAVQPLGFGPPPSGLVPPPSGFVPPPSGLVPPSGGGLGVSSPPLPAGGAAEQAPRTSAIERALSCMPSVSAGGRSGCLLFSDQALRLDQRSLLADFELGGPAQEARAVQDHLVE